MADRQSNDNDKNQVTINQNIYPLNSGPETNTRFMKPGFKTITCFFAAVFFPLIAFSIVILWLIFHYRVQPAFFSRLDLQTAPNENDVAYYYVNFPATQLLFITSWSSTIAPILVGFIMTLSLFPISKKLFEVSLSDNLRRLPTPYQFSVLMGFSQGKILTFWYYIKYGFQKRRAKQSTGLKMSAVIYTIALILSSLIVIMDTVLHITTKTVSIYETTVAESPNSTFGRGLNAACANWTESQAIFSDIPDIERTEYQPCTVYVAVTSEGLNYPYEVYRTLNNVSSENQVLQVATGNSTTGDLFLLGPAASLRSSNSDYKATTIGVSTSCKAISKLCNLQSTEGASTSFNCSSGWSGNLEVPSYNPTALIQAGEDPTNNYTSSSNNFGLGVFADNNLTKAYNIMGYDLANATHTTPNPFYLGVAAFAASGMDTASNISSDPQIVNGGHGGLGFVLTCQVNTYDVTYAYVNGTISPTSVTGVVNNGTVGWNFLGPLTFQGTRLAQMVDVAALQNNSAELALSYGNQFSSLATAMLAGAYDGRTILEQQFRSELLVAKVLKSAIWILILFNLLFAVGGGLLGVWAFVVAMSGTGDAQALFSVEGVVGMCFEGKEFGAKGVVQDRFEEKKVGEMSGRVGVVRKEDGWALQRVNMHTGISG